MVSRTVTNVTELKRAQDENADKIIVKGKLAKNLILASAVTSLSVPAIAALTIAVAGFVAAPATGGISAFVGSAAAVASGVTLTGAELVAIVALVTQGLTVAAIVALFQGYTITGKSKYGDVTFEKK